MAYDVGLAARIADCLETIGEKTVRQRNVFGGRGFLIGKSMFASASTRGMLVKVPPGEYRAALTEAGVTPFAPGGEKPMGTWVIVADESIADDPELIAWLRRGIRAVR